MTLLVDAIAAYLEPLLKKHAVGESVVWEDLEASHAASQQVLEKSGNFFVTKRAEDLHRSQVQAYREAAVKALKEWSQSTSAPSLAPMEENDTEVAFVERCVASICGKTSATTTSTTTSSTPFPNWKLDNARMVVAMETRKRARAIYIKYHPVVTDADADTHVHARAEPGGDTEDGEMGGDSHSGAEDGEEGDDDDDEDGEMGEGGALENAAAKVLQHQPTKKAGPKRTNANAHAKQANNNNNKKKGGAAAKKVVRKKANATNAKQATPGARAAGRNNNNNKGGGGASNRGRRRQAAGGGGGGNANNNKSN